MLSDTLALDMGSLFDTDAVGVDLGPSDVQILEDGKTALAQGIQDAAKQAFAPLLEQVSKAKAEHAEERKRILGKRPRVDEEKKDESAQSVAAPAGGLAPGHTKSADAASASSKAHGMEATSAREEAAAEFMHKARAARAGKSP